MRNLILFFALIFSLPLAAQIPVNTPFEANTNNALDNRLVQDNLSDTASIVFKYDGMLVYFKDVSQLWTWKGSWSEFSSGATSITAGANITVTGIGDSGDPYVITGVGGSGIDADSITAMTYVNDTLRITLVSGAEYKVGIVASGGASQYQFFVDDYGANGTDGLNDDAGFQACWNAMRNAGGNNLGLSPGGIYHLKDIQWGTFTSDSSMIVIDLNGATIICDTTSSQRGSINMTGANNVIFQNGTIKGIKLGAGYNYNTNHSFIHLEFTENILFENMAFMRPTSHAVTALTHVPTTGTEKRGITFSNCLFNYHLENISTATPSNEFSYIRLESGAEYNMFDGCKAFRGFQWVRGFGNANDTYVNMIAEQFNNPFFNADSIYESAILYLDTLSASGGNCGKFQFTNLKFNHNLQILPIAIKQLSSLQGSVLPRTSKFVNCDFLVNGADVTVSEQVFLLNSDDTKFTNCTFRPRQNPNKPTIVIHNSNNVSFTGCEIYQSSGGVNGLELQNSNPVYLDNNRFLVNNLIDPDSRNSTISYLSNPPTYANYQAVLLDTLLAEGSLFKLNNETSSEVKLNAATSSSIDKPYLVLDDNTRVEGTANGSSQSLVIIQGVDLPTSWKTENFTMKMRFKFNSVFLNSQIFSMAGTNGFAIDWRSTTTFDVVWNDGTSNTEATANAITPIAGQWYTLVMNYGADDTLSVTINDTLMSKFHAPNVQQNLNTNARYFGGPAINGAVGFDGAIDYVEWTGAGFLPSRIEFGNFDPDITYTTNISAGPGKTGSDFKSIRVISDNWKLSDTDGRTNVSIQDIPISAVTGLADTLAYFSHLAASATLDFPSIAADTAESLTVTVTGAAVGDVVNISQPGGVNDFLIYSAHVSSANTVNIKVNNVGGSAIDPASAVFNVMVWKYPSP